MNAYVVSIITKIFICWYWIVLIGFNLRNFKHMQSEAKRRNR